MHRTSRRMADARIAPASLSLCHSCRLVTLSPPGDADFPRGPGFYFSLAQARRRRRSSTSSGCAPAGGSTTTPASSKLPTTPWNAILLGCGVARPAGRLALPCFWFVLPRPAAALYLGPTPGLRPHPQREGRRGRATRADARGTCASWPAASFELKLGGEARRTRTQSASPSASSARAPASERGRRTASAGPQESHGLPGRPGDGPRGHPACAPPTSTWSRPRRR